MAKDQSRRKREATGTRVRAAELQHLVGEDGYAI